MRRPSRVDGGQPGCGSNEKKRSLKTMSKRNAKIFITLFFAIFATVTGVGIVVPLLPVYAKTLGAGGFFIGLIFGIFSFIRATNPIFADPLIAVIPRLFIGVGSYYIYYLLKKYNVSFALILAGIIGTLINTVFVLGLAVLRGYLPFKAAASVAVLHGIPEVILAAVIVVIVGKAILSIQNPSGAK